MDAAPPEKPLDARTRILDAAEALVHDKGVSGLTLAAAARLAGVSKGGLLYHFASKEALLDAALKRLAEYFRSEFEAGVAMQPEGSGRIARATIGWAFGVDEACAYDERDERAAAVYLAAFHHDPALLDPVRAIYADIIRGITQDGLPPGHGAAIMAAADGALMWRIFRLRALPEDERRSIAAALTRLLEPAP
ncbi:MAG TPA: TetR/AcrR family transcriptional regulator [Roseomonas sp.]|jgi:AcrR family transcriptional regulator